MSKSSDLDELSMLMIDFFVSAMKHNETIGETRRYCQTSRRLSGAFWRSLESLMLLLWRHQGV